MSALWTGTEIAEAVGGECVGSFTASGVAFDSREVGPGDLFIALKGEAADGHHFVARAFASGAAGAIVSEPVDGPHVRVTDTMVALQQLGRAGRDRATRARIIGVTGSVGKTGTKEALFAALDRGAPGQVHRSVKSYNNHTGVPLSLARMPADTRFGIFEMGMNHPGELAELTRLVRPHVAIVTAIAPAHAAYFSGEEAIADAKGEIFQGLERGGTAIIPYDSPHRDRLTTAAGPHAARILTFGRGAGADVRAIDEIELAGGGTMLTAMLPDRQLSFALSQPGEHWVSNAMAVLAAVDVAGGDLIAAGVALADMAGLPGRGARVTVAVGESEARIIDESYNANPASMLATLKQIGREEAERRVVILGEMRELGAGSLDYHAELAEPVIAAGVAVAILVGRDMGALADRLEGKVEVRHVADAAAALDSLPSIISPGDVILIKGSNAIGLSGIVRALADGALAHGKTQCSI